MLQRGKGIASGGRRLPGFRQHVLDPAQQGEGLQRLDDVAVGAGFVAEEDVDVSVEQQDDRPFVEITHLFAVANGETSGDATHVADLEIEQNECGIDLLDGGYDVDAGPHPMKEMGAGYRRFDLVGQPVGIGGEKDVGHGFGWYTRGPNGPTFRAAVSCAALLRYHAPVLEIRVDRHEDHVQLCPEGELDAYSVAQFREAFAELGTENRLIVNLGGVQFMDSAGLGALIGGIRKVRENDGRIAVFCDRANITRLLHTTGFDRIVPVKEALPEAVASLDEDQS